MNGKGWRVLTAAMVLFMFGAYGCILDSEDEKPDDSSDEIDWPDLTEKEDCIETIQLLYDNYNRLGDISRAISEHYEMILYDDPADLKDYVWYMSPIDVMLGQSPTLTRAQDIAGTEGLFKYASNLDFNLQGPPEWEETDVCDNCWTTTRQYSFICRITVNGLFRNYVSDLTNVQFVVGPHHDDANKWAIYQASDLKEQ